MNKMNKLSKINNTNSQLQILIQSYCDKFCENNTFEYYANTFGSNDAAEYLYPLICYFSESEFYYYYNREEKLQTNPLFRFDVNNLNKISRPVSVRATDALSKISFSSIAPFFIYWLKVIVQKYHKQMHLIYRHYPPNIIFKN